jgi:hypothetical protein
MTAYIPRWRGEAKDVVVASDMCHLCLFVFEGIGSNSSTNLESVTNKITNRMVLHLNHTPCFELDCLLSSLASLCVVDTFLELINQIL